MTAAIKQSHAVGELPFWRSRIGRRMLLAILAFSSALTLVITAFDLHLDYRAGRSVIRQQLASIQTGYAAPLGESLWNLDKDQVVVQVRSIAALADIDYVEVRDMAGTSPFVVTAGRPVEGAAERRDIPLFYERGGKPQTIGILHIESSLDELYHSLIQRALIILAGEAFKVFLTAAFVLFIVHQLVVRNLLDFTRTIRSYRPGVSQPLHVRHDRVALDEFDELVVAFNALGERVVKDMLELREGERRFHAIFDQTFQFIGVLTTDGMVRQINQTALQFAGVDEEAVLGKPFWETPWWKHSSEMQQRLKEAIRQAAAGEFVRFEATHVAADGQVHYIDFSLKPVMGADGRVEALIPEGRDLTERKQVEEEIKRYRDHLEEEVRQRTAELRQQQVFSRAVLENIDDGIVACDGQGTLSYFNRATRLIHGIDKEDLPPERWSEHYRLLEEDGTTPMSTNRIPLLRAFRGELVREQPLIVAHADGSRRLLLCSGQAMFAETGEKLGAVVSMHDVTEQKRAEAELIMARDAAESANRAKSLFLANMSHELRTPLNAILGFSSMLHRDPDLGPAQRENVDIINRSGEHLLALINDVLEIAKIESGRLRLEVAPFDLGDLVRDVTEMMRLRAEQKGLSLGLDQSFEFPRFIKGDEARLRQILVNLVGNAVKFTGQGGVIIRLGVKENHRSHLLIEVEDTGPGIRPEDRQRLFQPFQQLAEGAKQGGTGLGLAITRQFVQMMDGNIGVESEPGRGSCFRVVLPLEPASEEEVRRLGDTSRGEVVGMMPGQPVWRILIAEDQHENQMLLERLMADLGLQTRTTANGEECVRLFEEWQPDLIWMDRRMPVMDGVEAARRIRNLPGGDKVKIVAVTASVFKEQQPEVLEAGMDDLVRKPYRADEIYDCMARQLGARFVFRAATAAAPGHSHVQMTPERLAALPQALRTQLTGALEVLDIDRIKDLVQQVAAIDARLATTMFELVDCFDYPAILAALEAGNATKA